MLKRQQKKKRKRKEKPAKFFPHFALVYFYSFIFLLGRCEIINFESTTVGKASVKMSKVNVIE